MPLIKTVARRLVDAAGLGRPARRLYRSWRGPVAHAAPAALPPPPEAVDAAYAARVASEKATYRDDIDVHALPDIFHYWSNRYLGPKVRAMGYPGFADFFFMHTAACLERSKRPGKRILSIGAGNCDTEVQLARALVAAGHRDFVIECLELNPYMLARGKQLAEEGGVADFIEGHEADFNRWVPTTTYEAVIANQSLHHVMALEHVFAAVHAALEPRGRFIVSDIIGRNGHLRWPEALEIVHEFWRELPESHRYNHLLKRHEDLYDNWDCSISGFEGIRAQDILPLLLETFRFESFLAFSNVVDPFVDRAFGHNFAASKAEDLAFIDRIEARDEQEILSGRIKPTHMAAVMHTGTQGDIQCLGPLTPRFCVRIPD